MKSVRLEDILISEEKATPADICGKLLGQVSNGQLLAVINGMEAGPSTAPSGRNTLPRAISFQEDEE